MPLEADPGLVSASAVTLGASIVVLLIALVRSKIVAVLLGTGGVAVLANIVILSSLTVMLSNAFTGSGATRAITEARAAGRVVDVRWLIRYTLAVPLLIACALMVLQVVAAPQVSLLITGTTEYAGLMVLAAILIPPLVFAAALGQVLQAFLKVARIAAGSLVANTTILAATVVFAIPFGLPGALAAIGFGAVARVAYLYRSERSLLRGWRHVRSTGDRPRLSPILSLSLSGTVLGLASVAVALLVRSNIVGILGLDANGVYQPVVEISDFYLEVILTSTSLYLFAKITELVTVGRRTEAAAVLGHGLRLLMVLTVPIALVSIGFSELLIRVLYSDDFAAASGPLEIQMAGSVFKVIAWSVGAALLPLGMYRSWLAIGLVTLAIRYAGVLLLAPSLGLDGVADLVRAGVAMGCGRDGGGRAKQRKAVAFATRLACHGGRGGPGCVDIRCGAVPAHTRRVSRDRGHHHLDNALAPRFARPRRRDCVARRGPTAVGSTELMCQLEVLG